MRGAHLVERIRMSVPADTIDVGIGISSSTARAILVRDGRVTWAKEVTYDENRSLLEALTELVDTLPRRRRTVRAIAAVGPALSQLRSITQLPAAASDRLLADIVHENAGRYFLKNGIPLLTTSVERNGDVVWAAALEQPVVEILAEVCEARGIRLLAVVPTVCVLGAVCRDELVAWTDGDVTSVVTLQAGRVAGYRRLPSASAHVGSAAAPPPIAALDALGDSAPSFVDAWAATCAHARGRIAYVPTGSLAPERNAVKQRGRRRRAAIAVALCAVFAIGAQVAHTWYAERRARRVLGTLGDATRAALLDERLLASSVEELRTFDRFERSARSLTMTLAEITETVEPPTMLLSFQSDSGGGTVTAITPSAATLVSELGSIRGMVAPTIVGAVTPVTPQPAVGVPMQPMAAQQPDRPSTGRDAAQRMERVQIRFTWRSASSARAPGAAKR